MLKSACDSPLELMQAWRRQLGQRARLAERHGPRPFAVVGYRAHGSIIDGCVPLRHLMLVALYDERNNDGSLSTRLVGVAGDVSADGLRFGGPTLSRFDKDLRLAPAAGGRGRRLNAADTDLLSYAMQLERYLERCARHPYMPRRRIPRLPPAPAVGLLGGSAAVIDLTSLPKRQVLSLSAPRDDLQGTFGSTQFDFYHTRFRVDR